ncbi:MAG: cysteine desulfurase [Lachnospiraceae bacterium]|nr:cysteine desulfurase [Lachnospiraceae bacterium]
MEHYLDNAATTRPSGGVISVIRQVLEEDWGNPSSLHRKGQEAEKYLRRSRRQIASVLLTGEESVFFTSCATESTNTCLKGAVYKQRHVGKHILTTRGEHAATYEVLKVLANEGFEIQEIDNDETGRILLQDLEAKLRPDTALVTAIHVNNETGVIQPVKEMGKLIKDKAPKALFHVDATQSFAKYALFPDKWGIDMISASAHKINGPKGVGLLYLRRGLQIPALLAGGGQENRFRSGTENVPFIAGFGQAAEEMWKDHEAITAGMQEIKLHLVHRLLTELEGVTVNGPSPEDGAAHIVNVRIDRVRSEVLLHALEDDGVYVSSGSACSSNKPMEKSRPLAALGLSAEQIDNSLRISFGRFSDMTDADACVDSILKNVPVLRMHRRR